jgi:hypothetical protein
MGTIGQIATFRLKFGRGEYQDRSKMPMIIWARIVTWKDFFLHRQV